MTFQCGTKLERNSLHPNAPEQTVAGANNRSIRKLVGWGWSFVNRCEGSWRCLLRHTVRRAASLQQQQNERAQSAVSVSVPVQGKSGRVMARKEFRCPLNDAQLVAGCGVCSFARMHAEHWVPLPLNAAMLNQSAVKRSFRLWDEVELKLLGIELYTNAHVAPRSFGVLMAVTS